MATNASIGYNTRFAIEDAPGSGVFVELAEIISVTPPELSVDQVDVTHMQSPNRTREYKPALSDNGTATAEMNYVPNSATDQRIRALRSAGTVLSMRITFPSGVTMTFSGSVESYSQSVDVADKMTATVGFKVTTDPVVGAVAAPANSTLPAVSGVAQEGETVTAWEGVWTNTPVFAYQWQEKISSTWTNINGATLRTLVVPGGSTIGRPIRVVVTGTNAAGSASANSIETANVIAA